MALMYCRECGKQVSSEAQACPHCGVPYPTGVALMPPPPPAYLVPPAHNPALAGVLSFLWPGLGQIYKGQVGAGFGWMLATACGYVALIIPGLILHIFCVLDAAKKHS
ncbi:MAG TPA: zinc-ribbon domain-containing protein [Longimicrobium sp.]|nr:zinc-ribbon domain-containing protein [Longimicrobium sp.]